MSGTNRPDLSEVRKHFPHWPSELDVAKVPAHWAQMAQSFFLAAQVLNDEQRKAHRQWLDNVGQPADLDAYKRSLTMPAAFFCLAFSLELALKAALVKQGALDNLGSGQALPFSSHNLYRLAQDVDGLYLDADHKECLEWASEIIASGKYPVGKKPRDDTVSHVNRAFSDLTRIAGPLYGELMEMAADQPE